MFDCNCKFGFGVDWLIYLFFVFSFGASGAFEEVWLCSFSGAYSQLKKCFEDIVANLVNFVSCPTGFKYFHSLGVCASYDSALFYLWHPSCPI